MTPSVFISPISHYQLAYSVGELNVKEALRVTAPLNGGAERQNFPDGILVAFA
jgi:hypothetical protein